jgi:hypothetical protein
MKLLDLLLSVVVFIDEEIAMRSTKNDVLRSFLCDTKKRLAVCNTSN